jgi:thiamine kinase-like enzyme
MSGDELVPVHGGWSDVPASHREAARRAVAAVAGDLEPVVLTPLGGGRSGAHVFRIAAEGERYVLRIVTQPSPLNDPARQFAAMRIAAAAGIAPPLLYAEPASGIAVSAFIESRSWHEALADNAELPRSLGALLRRLHDGPPLPAFLDALQCIDQALLVLRSAQVPIPPLMQRYLADVPATADALRPHLVLGPSHNDMNPGNILVASDRIWIIDWEAAWQNDPMFDVATAIHWLGLTAVQEDALRHGYFGAEATPLERAKLVLMQQVVSCYYAIVFLLLAMQSGGVPALDPDPDTLPSFEAMRTALRAGDAALESGEDRVRFALVMVQEARRRMQSPEYAHSLTVLAENRPR